MPITKKTKRKPPRADEIVRKEIRSGKRMVVQFPTSLYRETLAAVEELQVNQADLIRSAAGLWTFPIKNVLAFFGAMVFHLGR